MKRSITNALTVFSTHGGVLRTRQALALGIAPRTLYSMREMGMITRLDRGIYYLPMPDPLGYPDLINVFMRVPKAIICLISALHFYGLTSHIPHRVSVALPQSAVKPKIEFPPLDIIWLSEKVYSAGIVEQQVDGFTIKMYSKEKTIADCFKFRNKIGITVAVEALKEYLAQRERSIDLLLSYARLDRVEKLISPYLEALI